MTCCDFRKGQASNRNTGLRNILKALMDRKLYTRVSHIVTSAVCTVGSVCVGEHAAMLKSRLNH